jgi:hypothetical protein
MLSDGVVNLCLFSHCTNKQQFTALQRPCWVPGGELTPYPTHKVEIGVFSKKKKK